MASRNRPPGLVSVGFQQIDLADSTAVSLNSTMQAARVLRVTVETNPARYRDDGTVPALTTGVLLPTGSVIVFDGFTSATIANVSFQRSTGNSKVSVLGYKYPSD